MVDSGSGGALRSFDRGVVVVDALSAEGDTPKMSVDQLTLVGNLTADPELQFGPSGVARANFTVASTPRRFDKATSRWVDGDALFMRCVAWGSVADNVANSLGRGDRVIVLGPLQQRRVEKDGQTRTYYDLRVEEIGPSLRWATAQPQKLTRGTRELPPRAPDPWAAPNAPAQGEPPW